MGQFSRWIKTGNDRYEFWFTEIFEFGYVRVFITVVDTNRRLLCFNLKKNKDWKITEAGNLPSWILSMEKELSNAIKVNPGRME
jgi:hypothetical protein